MAEINEINIKEAESNVSDSRGTDGNTVTQINTTNSANYRVLMSATADDSTRTESARKSINLTFNPSVGMLTTHGITTNCVYSPDIAFDADARAQIWDNDGVLEINGNAQGGLSIYSTSEITLNSPSITIKAPNGSASGVVGNGTSGYCLKTNGSKVYWASDNNTSRPLYLHCITITGVGSTRISLQLLIPNAFTITSGSDLAAAINSYYTNTSQSGVGTTSGMSFKGVPATGVSPAGPSSVSNIVCLVSVYASNKLACCTIAGNWTDIASATCSDMVVTYTL